MFFGACILPGGPPRSLWVFAEYTTTDGLIPKLPIPGSSQPLYIAIATWVKNGKIHGEDQRFCWQIGCFRSFSLSFVCGPCFGSYSFMFGIMSPMQMPRLDQLLGQGVGRHGADKHLDDLNT